RPMFGYLSREEMLAVIGTPDGTWFSQRDHVLLLLLYNTGARVSEIAGVKVGEVVLDEGAVRCAAAVGCRHTVCFATGRWRCRRALSPRNLCSTRRSISALSSR
ncbi:MAG: tyrosine-type recombinase/integrase, partial [Sedimenticolaceae bacterium]